jgi:hypothetical protein
MELGPPGRCDMVMKAGFVGEQASKLRSTVYDVVLCLFNRSAVCECFQVVIGVRISYCPGSGCSISFCTTVYFPSGPNSEASLYLSFASCNLFRDRLVVNLPGVMMIMTETNVAWEPQIKRTND